MKALIICIQCCLVVLLMLSGCTKLEEKFLGDLSEEQVIPASTNTTALLSGVYNSMVSPFTSHFTIFPLQELCTDEALAPTRGPDWDDNGVWRAFHEQKWSTNNEKIKDCFNTLNGISFAATDLLRFNPKLQEQAEARLIRAWVMYLLLDMFDQVPYRDPGERLTIAAKVRKGLDALNYIILELNTIKKDLPLGPPHKANQYAANVLLMKCYLNKAVYENRTAPVFKVPDMNLVISLADELIHSAKFSLAQNYFDNFAPDNSLIGTENIFTISNTPGMNTNNLLFFSWLIVCHYNSFFGQGWTGANGWTTLSDFYNKFDHSDIRKGNVYFAPGSPPNPGNRITAGFLIGQQYNLVTDEPLNDRTGAPLIFSPDVKNIELGSSLELSGIRPIKYFPDFPNYFTPDNDFVFFRFSDVLLMKAEAILRGGTRTDAGVYGNTSTSIVNAIRTHPSRGASAISEVTLDSLFDERGRELWWEGWRRQDMIRFGRFLKPFQEKNYSSDTKYLIFPIPDEQIAVNPNLIQNPGY